jgi:hypothetical protein
MNKIQKLLPHKTPRDILDFYQRFYCCADKLWRKLIEPSTDSDDDDDDEHESSLHGKNLILKKNHDPHPSSLTKYSLTDAIVSLIEEVQRATLYVEEDHERIGSDLKTKEEKTKRESMKDKPKRRKKAVTDFLTKYDVYNFIFFLINRNFLFCVYSRFHEMMDPFTIHQFHSLMLLWNIKCITVTDLVSAKL